MGKSYLAPAQVLAPGLVNHNLSHDAPRIHGNHLLTTIVPRCFLSGAWVHHLIIKIPRSLVKLG